MAQALANGSDGVVNTSAISRAPAPLDVRYKRNERSHELKEIQASKLEIMLATGLQPLPEPSSLVFGEQRTDHMLIVEHEPVKGWGIPRIQPYQPLQLDPASHCLHYSSNLFEGLKVCSLDHL
jgi:hypothetical protein